MRINGKLLPGTPLSAAMMNPWVQPNPLCPHGKAIGVNLRSRRPFLFDPWALRDRGITTGNNWFVIGERNSGKNGTANKLTLAFAPRTATVDQNGRPQEMHLRMTTRKILEGSTPEAAPITEFLHGNLIDLNRAGMINLFDPTMGATEWDQVETAVNVAEMANDDRPLSGFQPLIAQVAVYRMLREYGGMPMLELLEMIVRGLSDKDVRDYFDAADNVVLQTMESHMAANPELRRQLQLESQRPYQLPLEQFEEDKMYLAQLYGRVLRGDFGRVFGGGTSLYQAFIDPVTTFNLIGMTPKARSLFEAMSWKWTTMGIASGNKHIVPGMSISDEEHEGTTSLIYMRFWAQNVAKARMLPTFDLRLLQFLRQLTGAGDAGSEIRSKAAEIMSSVGGYIIGSQPPEDESNLEDLMRLGVSELDLQLLTQRPQMPGRFLIKVPGYPTEAVQIVLTARELDLSETNFQAREMMQFNPAAALERYRQFSQRLVERALHDARVIYGREVSS